MTGLAPLVEGHREGRADLVEECLDALEVPGNELQQK